MAGGSYMSGSLRPTPINPTLKAGFLPEGGGLWGPLGSPQSSLTRASSPQRNESNGAARTDLMHESQFPVLQKRSTKAAGWGLGKGAPTQLGKLDPSGKVYTDVTEPGPGPEARSVPTQALLPPALPTLLPLPSFLLSLLLPSLSFSSFSLSSLLPPLLPLSFQHPGSPTSAVPF